LEASFDRTLESSFNQTFELSSRRDRGVNRIGRTHEIFPLFPPNSAYYDK
jgi:hypothetical protein